MNNNDNSLNDILDSLAVSKIPAKDNSSDEYESLEYDEKAELIKTLKGLDELIKTNASVLEEAKRLVESTGDAEYFEVFSNIGKAQSEAFKNKVKILTDKEKNKILKETKEKELSIKDKLADFTIGQSNNLPSGTTLNQTNVIMSGSREEMFEMLLKMKAHEDESKPVQIDIKN